MSKLLISFTGVLYAIHNGRLTEEDLADALFYFGCTRQHALNPGAEGEANELEWVSEDRPEQERVHQILTNAILEAEKDGRIVWRAVGSPNTFEQLNALLEANGYSGLDFGRYDQPYYKYPTVQQAVTEQGYPLEVVWRG